jgi:hypothetical protein
MRKLLLILALCSPVLPGFSLDDGLKSVSINNSSGFIYITVLSNINKESFQYNLKQQCLSYRAQQETGYVQDTSVSRIIVPVKEFKCTDRYVYKDFLTLLKVEQYPNLEIDMPHNSNIEYYTDNSVILKGVSITVAGVSRQYDINCKINNVDNDNQILNGTALIKLTDLEIIPPVKMFGLVKVKNEITINFEFCLKSSN